MGKEMVYWCDMCGMVQESGSSLEEFAYRYGEKRRQVEVCQTCGDATELYLREQVQHKNGPAQ